MAALKSKIINDSTYGETILFVYKTINMGISIQTMNKIWEFHPGLASVKRAIMIPYNDEERVRATMELNIQTSMILTFLHKRGEHHDRNK